MHAKPWTRRGILGGAVAGIGASLSSCSSNDSNGGQPQPLSPKPKPRSTKQPNMIVVITDDQRWDHLSASPFCPAYLQTPNLDRLAEAGTMMKNAFVTTALCSPSRATFLTGKYASQHGVKNNLNDWNPNQKTVFEPLAEAGYDCAFIGKWHMPGELPNLRGVDRFITFTAQGGQGQYFDCPLLIDGEMQARPNTYVTEDLTTLALEWISERPQDRPWCLYLAHKAVHHQFEPPKHLLGSMDDIDLSHLPKEAFTFMSTLDRNVWEGTVQGVHKLYRRYLETLLGLDEQMGRLLDEIDLSETYLIFSSDNGYSWGEHVLTGKRWAYEENTRVPMLIAGPGIKPGVSNALVLNADVAPTLLNWAGAAELAKTQGRSMAGLLNNPNAAWRNDFMYEYFRDFPYQVPTMQALRNQEWLWIEYEAGKSAELFNLTQDPKTQLDLAVENPEKSGLMSQRLNELRAQIAAGARV